LPFERELARDAANFESEQRRKDAEVRDLWHNQFVPVRSNAECITCMKLGTQLDSCANPDTHARIKSASIISEAICQAARCCTVDQNYRIILPSR
jgi:hypothetical protein